MSQVGRIIAGDCYVRKTSALTQLAAAGIGGLAGAGVGGLSSWVASGADKDLSRAERQAKRRNITLSMLLGGSIGSLGGLAYGNAVSQADRGVALTGKNTPAADAGEAGRDREFLRAEEARKVKAIVNGLMQQPESREDIVREQQYRAASGRRADGYRREAMATQAGRSNWSHLREETAARMASPETSHIYQPWVRSQNESVFGYEPYEPYGLDGE